jgi:hypothetical protein
MHTHIPAFSLIFAASLCLGPLSTSCYGETPAPESAPWKLPDGVSMDDARDAGKAAISKLMQEYAQSKGDESLASFIVLPLQRDLDQNYFTAQFENAFVKHAGADARLYTRNDAAVAEMLKQIAWGQNYQDVLDQSTIQKLGSVVDAQAILFPRLDISVDPSGAIRARANMQIHERKTFRIHWGDEAQAVIEPRYTSDDIIRLLGWTAAGLAVFLILFKLVSAIRRAARPR